MGYNKNMSKILIQLKNLTKIYGKKSSKFTALSDINIDILQGESLAIVGKSGSGKSTLMHQIALLDRPNVGEIIIDGQNTKKMSNSQRDKLRSKKFGFIFQQFFMNPKDSVFDNVALPLKLSKAPILERKTKTMEALKAVDLADKAKNKAQDLSGGQKQRVCISRALVNNPEIILADEPTGNLDSTTGKKVIDLLFRLHKERGITLIIVTHDSELASRCNRQITISDGKIVSDLMAKKEMPTKTKKLEK